MAESEQSFADRIQKSQQLHDACNGFTPAYVPSPGTITLSAFQTMISTTTGHNSAVAIKEADWNDAVNRRIDEANLIKLLTTHLIAYVKPVTAWKSHYPQAKRLADTIRGMKPPRKTLPPPPPGEPAKKQIERGGQSFAELESNFDALVTLCVALAGFAPPDPAISASLLSSHLSSIKSLNKEVSMKEADLSEAQKVRYAAYYDENGLADRFKEVKANVKGQYGPASTQWAQVKGMKW